MGEVALLIAAFTSSLSAALLIGITKWLYGIDKRTTKNHNVLHGRTGIVENVRQHHKALIQEGMINGEETE